MSTLPDLEHFGLYDPNTQANVDGMFAMARTACPVARSEQHGAFYYVTWYEDCVTVARDHETFASDMGREIPPRPVTYQPPLHADPPILREFRNLMLPFLTPKAVRQYEPQMRAPAARVRDSWAETDLDEFLRHDSSVIWHIRKVTRPVVLGGQRLKQNDLVMVCWYSDWHNIFDVNLFGYVPCINAFVPGMLERRSGWVVNVCSGAPS